jgi:hypothetical protein
MGIDLIGREGECLSYASWGGCLELAGAFGWQPAGTSAPSGHQGPWAGDYCYSDGQEVSDGRSRDSRSA